MNYEKSILDVLNKIGTDNDHLVMWRQNNKMYTFKGNEYWRYTVNFNQPIANIKNDKGYPIRISSGWNGIPNEFDSVGYIMFNGSYKLIFFKGSECWLYDDVTDKVVDGYPKKISQFPLFLNKIDFQKITGINHIFIWHGQTNYNCFVAGSDVFLIPWNKPSSFEKNKLNSMFPALPDFVSNILPIHDTPYIAFQIGNEYLLYHEANGSYYDKNGIVTNENIKSNGLDGGLNSGLDGGLDGDLENQTKINDEKNKMLEWCLQLYHGARTSSLSLSPSICNRTTERRRCRTLLANINKIKKKYHDAEEVFRNFWH